MYTSIVILVVLASILMCLIVLIQESKGGGLSAAYSNNNQILGAPKTTNFVEKATWTLAIIIIVLCIAATAFVSTKADENNSALIEKIENTAPVAQPQFPAEPVAPATEETPAN